MSVMRVEGTVMTDPIRHPFELMKIGRKGVRTGGR